MRCTACGRLTPHLAKGRSSDRTMSDRLLPYEGYSPKGVAFEYKSTGLCFYCRDAKKRKVKVKDRISSDVREALWELNKRKEVRDATV